MPRNKAAAKKTMDTWFKARAKERRRAEAVEESRPRPIHKNGYAVEVIGNAKVEHHEGEDFTDTNHEGAVGIVEGSYYSEAKQTNVNIVRTEDNQIRGIPERSLRSMKNPAEKSVSRSSVSMSGTMSQDRWDQIFGKKDKR